MDYHAKSTYQTLESLRSSTNGLTKDQAHKNLKKYGKNELTKKKPRSVFRRIISILKEPMMIILLFSLSIALSINIAKTIAGGEGDFSECIGIFIAISISVIITLVMEGSSKRAFDALGKMMDSLFVKVVRDGKTQIISQTEVTVGDIIILSTGDKIIADGRVIESQSLSVNESALTGESSPVVKSAELVLKETVPLAERVNLVYSGTFVSSGEGVMVVTAIGDDTEIGRIAQGLKDEKTLSPLEEKLAKLGKKITLIGIITASVVFLLSVIRLIVTKTISFEGVQSLFISSIILIVAAVPEGLPTIVAVSLALNMIKLAKENALIKKMIATETTGAVSVICTDKTGTLTLNKMSVEKVCGNEFCESGEALKRDIILKNFALNTTAEVVKNKKEYIYQGSGTECALLVAYMKNKGDYIKLRREYQIIAREPFSSKTKIMKTTVMDGERAIQLVKGAPEVVINLCGLTTEQKSKLYRAIESYQMKAKRVLCFAHAVDGKDLIFDGYAVLSDKVRKEVKSAVLSCKNAGIKTIILTGDNRHTAYAVGVETGICSSPYEVINAPDIENISDTELKKILPKISVISRSTPSLKLRVVKLFKEMGEVVAVTGDGINDAPAIKHADVGIAMGKTGSEITKETADVILLDDSFTSVVKAVSFGRSVFRNLRRFIMFQLSVNISALLFITVCAVIGVPSPFTTLELLWINVIMDGPPALTLGLEKPDGDLMIFKPVKRDTPILSKKMMKRIALSSVYTATILLVQYFFNFMGVKEYERLGTVFSLFVTFQLFNAFNCRNLGSESVFYGLNKNKLMVITFVFTFVLQIFIVSLTPSLFGISSLSVISWLKIIGVGVSVIVFSEIYKLIYRKKKANKKVNLVFANKR